MQAHQQIDAVGLMDHAGFLDPHSHVPATDPFLTFLIQEFYPDDSHGLLSPGCGHQGSEMDFYFPCNLQSKPLVTQVIFLVFKNKK